MATPMPGCYLAGVIASGNDANRLFIENARGHGELIVRHLLQSAPALRRHRRNPVVPLSHHRDERLGDTRVELDPGAVLDVGQRALRLPGIAVGSIGP